MSILIWSGAAITILGFAGIVWSLVVVLRAKRAGLDDEALRARISRVMPLNFGSLLLSVLGLMLVVFGIFFS